MTARSSAQSGQVFGQAPKRCQSCVLGRAARSGVCPFSEVREPEQRVLVEQGRAATTVWYVKEGLVALSSVDSGGVELGCSVRGAGALLGLEAVLGQPSPYTASALTGVVLCSIGAPMLSEWLGQLDTPPGTLLQLGIEEASRRTAEQLALGGSSQSRVARFLLRRCVVGDGLRPLDVSQRVVARMLSMTPETLSRTLARLRALGAISGTRPVVVANLEALRAVAVDERA